MVSMICGLVSGTTQKQKLIRKRMQEGGSYTSLSEELALYPSILKKTIMEQRVYMIFHVLSFLGFFCFIIGTLCSLCLEPSEASMWASNLHLILIFGFSMGIVVFGFLAIIIDIHIDNLEKRMEMLERFIENRKH